MAIKFGLITNDIPQQKRTFFTSQAHQCSWNRVPVGCTEFVLSHDTVYAIITKQGHNCAYPALLCFPVYMNIVTAALNAFLQSPYEQIKIK